MTTHDSTLRRAQELIEDGQADEARTVLRDVLEAAMAAGQVRLGARASREIGSLLVSIDKPTDAVHELESVRAWIASYEKTEILTGLQDVAIAAALRAAHRSSDALHALAEGQRALLGRVPESIAMTLRHDQSVLLADLGRTDDAIAGFVASREAFLGVRDRLGVAAADHNLGYVLHDLGNFDDAIEYLQEARNIFLALDRPEEAAACDQNLGVIFFDLGRFEEAGRRFAVAHHRYDEVHARRSAGECDYNLGALLRSVGRDGEAAPYEARAAAEGVEAPLDIGLSGQVPAVPTDPAESADYGDGSGGGGIAGSAAE